MGKNEIDIDCKDLDFIEAEFVKVRQSTIKAVEGGHIELQQVGALSIDGERVEVTQGASLMMRGSNLSLNQSIGLVAAGSETNINFSCVPVSLAASEATITRSAVGILAAKEINSENNSAILMIGGNINGNVTTLLDWKSAVAVGAVAGGIFGLFSLLRKK